MIKTTDEIMNEIYSSLEEILNIPSIERPRKVSPIIITSTPSGENSLYKAFLDGKDIVTIKEVQLSKAKWKSKKQKYSTTLVIPDAHTTPGQDFSRFTAAGRYANEQRCNNIIFMGDFANFDSLSSFSFGKEQIHGKRYKDDCKAAKDALKVFFKEFSGDYKPNLIFLGGNHDEGRIEKYIETHSQLRGHMDLEEDLDLAEFGFKYVPYRRMAEIEGVLFSHAVMSAINQPISGKNILSTIASLTAKSIVVGHHHRFEHAGYMRFGADDIQQVLLCGLFSEDTEDYADGANNSYNRCLIKLTHTKKGNFDVDQISLARLKNDYL